jgi:succinyl-diaminopimelate desuccinylase
VSNSTLHPAAALTAELIGFPSVHPEDGGAQAHLIRRLEQSGFRTHHIERNGTKNFWAEFGTTGPLFVFAGHTDVVPAGDEAQWSAGPFTPTVRDGHLYGRGVVDMKGGVAASIVAIEQFLTLHPHPPLRLGVLIAGDEEIAGGRGTADVLEWLATQGKTIDYCIVAEPSSHHQVGDTIRTGRRGSMTGSISLFGVQGHSAYPELANNPIHAALAPLLALTQIEWDGGDEVFPPTILQITNIKSGAGAVNVIPGSLEALFNVRFSPAHSQESIEQQCRAVLDRALNATGIRYELNTRVTAEPFRTPSGVLTEIVTETTKRLTGLTPVSNGGGGTSDARFIAKTGAQVLELGLKNDTAHKVDEHAAVEEIALLTDLFRETLTAFCRR